MRPPKEIWGVWDGSLGAEHMTIFTQKTYAKQEASEARRLGDKSVVALRYVLSAEAEDKEQKR